MRGRAHRTNEFAWRILALHARHRLEISLRIITIALVVSIHAQPVHMAALVDLILADHRNVVFRLARNDAVVAADTRVQINRHAPRVGLSFVVVRWIAVKRLVVCRLIFVESFAGFLLVFLKVLGANDRTMLVAYIHRLIALGGGENIRSRSFRDLNSGCDPRSRTVTKLIGIESNIVAHASYALAAVAEKNRDGVIGMTGLPPHGKLNPLPVRLHADHVLVFHLQAFSHLGRHQQRIVPSHLRHWLGKFLQPGVVGELAVVDAGIAAEVQLNAAAAR